MDGPFGRMRIADVRAASLTCPRCRLPSYCSKYCGFQATQGHDELCVDVATAAGAKAAAVDAALAAVVSNPLSDSESEEYKQLAMAEAKHYLDLFGMLEIEAVMFPDLFILGDGGTFGGMVRRGVPERFCDYREHLLMQACGRWEACALWCAWSATVQARLELALRNERLGLPRGWDKEPFNIGRFAKFSDTLVLREPALTCHECGAMGELLCCARCEAAWYCGKGCQKKAWAGHKTGCKTTTA